MKRYIITKYQPAYRHLDEMIQNIGCLDAWLDSMQYEIINYLGEEKWKTLRAIMDALINNFTYVNNILQMIIHKDEEVQK